MFCPIIKDNCRNDCLFFDTEIPPPPNTQCMLFYSSRKIESTASDTVNIYIELIKLQSIILESRSDLKNHISEVFSDNNSTFLNILSQIYNKLDSISLHNDDKISDICDRLDNIYLEILSLESDMK